MLELPLGPTLPPINPPCRDRNEEEGGVIYAKEADEECFNRPNNTMILLIATVAVATAFPAFTSGAAGRRAHKE